MAGTKGMTHYRTETKLQAIQMHEEGGLTYAQVAEQLGIRQADRISAWNRAYRREGMEAFEKPIGRPRKDGQARSELEQLRMENALLKKFHTELRKIMLARRDIGSSNTTEGHTR
ncbi:MAG: transposase [Chloroflexi bacterium]|nr:transposase [Chloroflexota bacterium]